MCLWSLRTRVMAVCIDSVPEPVKMTVPFGLNRDAILAVASMMIFLEALPDGVGVEGLD